jgi:hypothetical protein
VFVSSTLARCLHSDCPFIMEMGLGMIQGEECERLMTGWMWPGVSSYSRFFLLSLDP